MIFPHDLAHLFCHINKMVAYAHLYSFSIPKRYMSAFTSYIIKNNFKSYYRIEQRKATNNALIHEFTSQIHAVKTNQRHI